jgi:chromate transport protein ChrA
MSTGPLQDSTGTKVAKFMAATLAAIGVAAAAFAASIYVSGLFDLRVPVANVSLSILLGAAGLVLSVIALRGRGSWKEAASFSLPALVAAAVAFRFGVPGVYLAVVLGCLAYLVLRRLQSWRSSKSDET